MAGKLLIVSAPSGAGKTTIVHRIMQAGLDLEFSVSACSRPKRTEEKDGVDYYFISVEEFRSMIDRGEFIEWQEVYKNQYYGTLRSEVERIWTRGKDVVFDVDVEGAINLKTMYPRNSLALFIKPPSFEILEKRLRQRSTDSEESIARRLDKARHELEKAGKFDRIIINDDLERAVAESLEITREFLGK